MSVRSHPPETAYGPMDNRVSGLSGGLPLSLEDDATRNQKKLVKMFSDMREIRRDGSSPSLTSDRSPGSPGSIAPGSPSNPSIKNYASERGKKGGVGANFIKAPITSVHVEKAGPARLAAHAIRGVKPSYLMVIVVMIDTVCTCMDIDARAATSPRHTDPPATVPFAIDFLSNACLTMYCLEFLVILYSKGCKVLRGLTARLDLLIIGCGVIEKILDVLWPQDSGIISLVRILRLVRIFRITRLLQRTKALRELSKLVMMMTTCLKALVWSFIFCFVIMTMWAMLMVEFIYPIILELSDTGEFLDCEHCLEATRSVMHADLLLFKTVIAGDSWGQIAVPVIMYQPLTAIIFMGSLLTLVFGVLNLIVAVVVDTFAEARQRDVLNLAEDLETDLHNDRKVLQRMFERMDADGSGLLTLEELVEGARQDPEFQSRLRVMDIDESDLQQLFEMIDSTGEGEIESQEFIAALSRWVHDSKTAPRFVKYNMLRSLQMQEYAFEIMQEQFDRLSARIDCSNLALETLLKDHYLLPTSSRSPVGSVGPEEGRPEEEELPRQPHRSLKAETLSSETLPPPASSEKLEAGLRNDARDAMAQLEQAVMKATEAALKRSIHSLEMALQGVPLPQLAMKGGSVALSVESSVAMRPYRQSRLSHTSSHDVGPVRSTRSQRLERPKRRMPHRLIVGKFSAPGASMALASSDLRRPPNEPFT